MSHPQTRRDDLVETLHGRQIADPYRWLEDPDAPEVVDWVNRQRRHADEVFAGITQRDWFTQTMRRIVQRPHRGAPWSDNGWYLQTRNDGSQAQDVLYGAKSLPALIEGGEVLLDPNTWSDDGTSSLAGVTVSPDGRLLAHAISAAGSDWTTYRFLDLETGDLLEDEVVTRFSSPTWLPDSSTVLYIEWAEAGRADGADATALSEPSLWLYRLGGDRAELFAYPDDPAVMFWAQVVTAREGGADQSWIVLHGSRGTERTNRLWAAPVSGDARAEVGEWLTVFAQDDQQRELVAIIGSRLLYLTHEQAVRGQVRAIDLADLDQAPTTVIAEDEGVLEQVWNTASGLLACHLVDVSPVLTRFSQTGERLGVVDLQVGAITAAHTEADSDEVFVATSSVAEPGQAWRLDVATGEIAVLDDPDALDALPVVQLRRHATSADGTQVPYWLLSRADLPIDQGPRPTLIYGYGGFTVPVQADFRPGWRGWLEAGGVLVITNLRGGGEFGQEWYDQGRREHKQHVFDDFIACAEHVIETGVTTSAQLTCYGRSNGGLLVGAAITQRPELYAAALPQVGVLDLLRFHTFTIGAAWISDYGNPDDPSDFETALAYSPLHNVRDEVSYPATLVITGDHDDRVVPAHSHKFTAALQAAQGGDAPVVTRVEPSTGHGSGKPARVIADEWADLLAWAAHFTGLEPDASR